MRRKYPRSRKCRICKRKYLQTRPDRGGKYCSLCGRANAKVTKLGENNPNWNGGRSISTQGYMRLGSDKGRIYEHRYIMERHLGRKLTPKEIARHINGNKTDNRIENLEIVSRSEHKKLHPEIGIDTRFKKLIRGV